LLDPKLVDLTLIAGQHNFKAKYLQNGKKNFTKSTSISF